MTRMDVAQVELADDAPHLLVVDDDRRLRQLLTRFLNQNGYRVTAAATAAEAEGVLGHMVFDLLILDVMMPGENGFDFARRLRHGSDVPIIMLTARTESADRVEGLETGADDYLSKPFEPRELLLRIGNVLRRLSNEGAESGPQREAVRFGEFLFRLDRGELRRDGEIVRITDRERDILTILANRAGEHVPREELAGHGGAASERTVDVQMNRLRRKVERDPANPAYLQTVRGIGYRLLVDG
ncbi:two-component system phosphate regulon response regulator OmpR [Chelatococcus asaccharovorans]|uniref:Two-component system phosphate regulon response regulator OmpR n=2 Tax=Chelatococcus asaccharovorans TaxID=28210 RepID=A0A2V3U0I7_9HYPH|nr:two-component system phosphate regulon response regulator OmpR [Chelatococcus asaccharovorans]